jgi:hypothetical protein
MGVVEAVALERRLMRPVKGRKARSNGVQPPQRPAVVVFVMAHNQSLGQPVHPMRLERKRSHCDRHGLSPSSAYGNALIVNASNCVTLSALVQSATLPAPENV